MFLWACRQQWSNPHKVHDMHARAIWHAGVREGCASCKLFRRIFSQCPAFCDISSQCHLVLKSTNDRHTKVVPTPFDKFYFKIQFEKTIENQLADNAGFKTWAMETAWTRDQEGPIMGTRELCLLFFLLLSKQSKRLLDSFLLCPGFMLRSLIEWCHDSGCLWRLWKHNLRKRRTLLFWLLLLGILVEEQTFPRWNKAAQNKTVQRNPRPRLPLREASPMEDLW